ncbi:hypothetical protein PCE1_001487 [Barthelona sp. PCE]
MNTEECLSGLNGWKNIQNIIRQTFCSMQMQIDSLNDRMGEKLSGKVDHEQLEYLLNDKLDVSTFEQSNRQINDILANVPSTTEVNNVFNQVENSINILRNETAQNIHSMQNTLNDILSEHKMSLENVERELSSMSSDLRTKPSVEEINDILRTVRSELDSNYDNIVGNYSDLRKDLESRLPSSSFDRFVESQRAVLDGLCLQTCVARFVWKSGRITKKSMIPWDVELVNTAPENFRFTQGKSTIITELPGLYEFTFGFYSERKPTIKILVNGHPILTAVNSGSYVVHHSSGRTVTQPHPDGNITGLTGVDYLALPPRARVTVKYEGPRNAEGFVAFRKL